MSWSFDAAPPALSAADTSSRSPRRPGGHAAALCQRCLPPFVTADGQHISGADVDLLRLAARRAGVALQVQLMPFKRLEQALRDGEEECAFAFSHTPARETYLRFSDTPLHLTRYTLFLRQRDATRYRTLADLAGGSVGVRVGFRLPATLQAAVQAGDIRLEETPSDESNLQKLALGRVDAVLTNLDVGRYQLRQMRLDGIVPQRQPLELLPTYLVFASHSPRQALLSRLDRELARLVRHGEAERALQRYR